MTSRSSNGRARPNPRKRWLKRLGIVMPLVAAFVGIWMVVGEAGDRTQSDALHENRVAHEIAVLLRGIPQEGDTLGQDTAPVTLQIFGDLECLTVKEYVISLLPAIIQEFVRTNIVKLEYRSFQTDTHDPTTFVNQQTAALAAGAQGMLWNFIETFYHEQGTEYTGYATEGFLDNIARQVRGLNIARWNNDRTVGYARRVITDNDTAHSVGFHDTPSFLIGRTGGKMAPISGRYVVLKFANQLKPMNNPVALVDARDLQTAIERLP